MDGPKSPSTPKTPTQLRPDEVGSLIRGTPTYSNRPPSDGAPYEDGEMVQRTEESRMRSAAPGSPGVTSGRPTSGGEPAPTSPASPLDGQQQKPAKKGGLVPSQSDAWKDTEVKKVERSDSQKRAKAKRTLSIKTRKHSLKEKFEMSGDLPPAEMEGFLERKQEHQSGGKKATIRSWKHFYTVLCGQLLCFFKDQQGMECESFDFFSFSSDSSSGVTKFEPITFCFAAFAENSAAVGPLAVHNAVCKTATDYTKKKNVLRLRLADGAEYLFSANSQKEMMDWQKKIQFHAGVCNFFDLSNLERILLEFLVLTSSANSLFHALTYTYSMYSSVPKKTSARVWYPWKCMITTLTLVHLQICRSVRKKKSLDVEGKQSKPCTFQPDSSVHYDHIDS